MLSLSAAACAYSLNAPIAHHVTPRSSHPVLAMGAKGDWQSAAVAAALAATLATGSPAFAAEPWAYSTLLDKTGSDEVSKVVFAEDGKGAVAFDQEGKDHPVQLFPGGDSELVQELRKRNVAFAVAPRPTPGAVASVLGTVGGVLLNFAPLLLLIGLNVLASRGGPGGAGGGAFPHLTLTVVLSFVTAIISIPFHPRPIPIHLIPPHPNCRRRRSHGPDAGRQVQVADPDGA